MRATFLLVRRGLPRLLTVLGIAAICMGSTSRSCGGLPATAAAATTPSFVTRLQLQDANGDITDTFDRGESDQFRDDGAQPARHFGDARFHHHAHFGFRRRAREYVGRGLAVVG